MPTPYRGSTGDVTRIGLELVAVDEPVVVRKMALPHGIFVVLRQQANGPAQRFFLGGRTARSLARGAVAHGFHPRRESETIWLVRLSVVVDADRHPLSRSAAGGGPLPPE